MAKSTEFELLGKIGEGGMGEVYRARLFNNHGFEKIVAAKKVIGATSDSNFLREAEVLSKLEHANICTIFDIREFDGNLYILMEYIDGLSLSALQEIAIQKGYKFTEEFILQIAVQVLQGLDYAHSSLEKKPAVIHRDISPQNIMISLQGNVKILDFGIAKIEKTSFTSGQESTYGKVRYSSPEVLNGEKYDQSSDLYALGVLLFEMCIGAKAFSGLSEVQIVAQKAKSDLNFNLIISSGYSEDLKVFIEKLSYSGLAKRFQSAKAALSYVFQGNIRTRFEISSSLLSDELKIIKSSEIQRTKTIPTSTRGRRTLNRNLLFCALVVLGVIILGILATNLHNQEVQPLDIVVQSDGSMVSLVPLKVLKEDEFGAKIGARMSDLNCLYGAVGLIDFSNAMSWRDRSKDSGLLKLVTPVEALRDLVLWHEHAGFIVEFLKKNCRENKALSEALVVLQDFQKSLSKVGNKQYETWRDLQIDLRANVHNRDKEIQELHHEISSLGEISILLEQINNILVMQKPVYTGYLLLSLDEKLFPKSLNECRELLDAYALHQAKMLSFDPNTLSNYDFVLVPFPVNASIVNYRKNYLEYKDELGSESSSFRKYGVCVLRRHNGEVVESSLRKL